MKRTSVLLALPGLLALAACADRAPDTAVAASAPRASLDAGEVAEQAQPFAEGQIVVRFHPGANRSEVAMEHSARVKRDLLLDRTVVMEVEPGKEKETAEKLSRHPNVEFAEPDYVIQLTPCEVGACLESNDSFMYAKWDLHNKGTHFITPTQFFNTGAADADIDWQEAYDYMGPNPAGTAVIAIIDTGIRKTHNDVLGKVIAERNFITTDPAQVNNAADDNGHGSHVAGIAAARANNTSGSAGVAYPVGIKLMALKACDAAGNCPNSATANALIWAADNGANVANMSFGGFGSAVGGSALHLNALAYAVSKNVLPVCSTGNDARKTNPATNNPVYTGGVGYPARFNNCFAVGATDWSDGWAAYSNWGPGIDVSAPGGDSNPLNSANSFIFSLSNSTDGTYTRRSGTSMAAPQVAGLAALLYAQGLKTPAEVRARIIASVDDKGPPGWDEKFGFGRINLYRALTGLDPSAPPVVVAGEGYAGVEGSPIAFDGSASYDPNGKGITWAWDFGDGATATGATPSHVFADDGAYAVTLRATDPAGLFRTAVTTTKVANAAPSVTASLSDATVASGATVALNGSFVDPGVRDAPWSWNVSWGGSASSTGTTTLQGEVGASHRVCGAGTRTVTLSVTDKDGGTGTASATLTVSGLRLSLSAPASFNTGANGTYPVTILTGGGIDAADVNPATVRFGGAEVATRPNGTLMTSMSDVDGDGDLDRVLHFDREAITASTTLTLDAGLGDGCRVARGAVTVNLVP